MELLLTLIQELGGDSALREFACWTARQTEPSKMKVLVMLDEVEALAIQGVEEHDLFEEYRSRMSGTAASAAVVGLKRGASNAASFLSAYACLQRDAMRAARLAVDRARIWYQLETGEPDAMAFDELLAGKARMMIIEELSGVLEN